MQTLPKGQYIKHFQYGLGVVTQPNAPPSTSPSTDPRNLPRGS
jgi:hypothetical protein